MTQYVHITHVKDEGSFPRGVTSGGAPTQGGLPSCRPAAPRRTDSNMSSSGTPFIPLLNLICGHLIPIGQEGHLSVPGASQLASSNFNLQPPGFPSPSPFLEKFVSCWQDGGEGMYCHTGIKQEMRRQQFRKPKHSP